MIREFVEEDQKYLQDKDMVSFYEHSFHQDVIPDSTFSSVDERGNVLGILYMKYHYSWNGDNEELNRICPVIICEDNDIRIALIRKAKQWFDQYASSVTGKNACLCFWADDKEAQQLFMHEGFLAYSVCPCLAYDLSNDIPTYLIPPSMHVEKLEYDPSAVDCFIQATAHANDGTPDSVAELWFMSNNPSYQIFVLKDGSSIVSSSSIWEITNERCAIENIFTNPCYRRMNLAKTIITYGLARCKELGYKTATLSMRGRNYRASHLYQSLGFTLLYNQIEMIYRTNHD